MISEFESIKSLDKGEQKAGCAALFGTAWMSLSHCAISDFCPTLISQLPLCLMEAI